MNALTKILAALLIVIGLAVVIQNVLEGFEIALPREWDPTQPLVVSDTVTPLTNYKMRRAISDPRQCKALLASAATFFDMTDLEVSPQCGIAARVSLSGVGASRLDPFETTCGIAVRLAMWERHGLQPAARAHLGADVAQIEHFSSYNCRPIRTLSGAGRAMSLHATAEAVDIAGFQLADGRRLSLFQDYSGTGPRAAFLRDVRDSACRWFETTLGPDYNSLHRDHFHLQSRGWGTCR